MLFILTDKLHLNMEYVLGYKEFAQLYEDYKGEGIAKVEAVFKYIFEVADPRSYSNRNSFGDDERHDRGLTYVNLSNLKITKNIKSAIKLYKDESYSLEIQLLSDLKDNIQLAIKTNSLINKSLSRKLDADDLSDADLSSLIGLQSKLFDIIDEAPDKIEAIKKLELKVYESYTKPRAKARGDKEIPSSYDGDPDIEGEL
jgi:hypothetical protein